MFDLTKLLNTEASKASREPSHAEPTAKTISNPTNDTYNEQRQSGNSLEALLANDIQPQGAIVSQPNDTVPWESKPELKTKPIVPCSAQLGDDGTTIISILPNESDADILAKLAINQAEQMAKLSNYNRDRVNRGVITMEEAIANYKPSGERDGTTSTDNGNPINNTDVPVHPSDNSVGVGVTTDSPNSPNRDAATEQSDEPVKPKRVNPLAPKGESLALKKVTLDASQIRAVNGALANTHVCIIGYAGTGKSTVVNNALEEALDDDERYVPIPINTARFGDGIGSYPIPPITCVAYTGRATTQLKNKLDERLYECTSTIHAMLAYAPEPEERVQPDGSVKLVKIFKPRFTAHNKLPWKKIVIDEAGMVPASLWNEIIAACKPSTEIMLVGDIAQLPPIHGYSPLPLAMKHWPTFELTTIHRQKGSDNTIPFNAQLIRGGSMPEWNKKDFIFETLPSSHLAARNKLIGIVKHLTKNGQFDPMQDAIISAQNVGHLGQEALNFELMTFFNASPRIEVVGGISNILAAEGDKVMNTKNDLQLGINNGMLGMIISIEANDKYKKSASAIASGSMGALSDSDKLEDIFALADADGTEAKEKASSLTQKAASHKILVEFENGVTKTFSTAGDISNLTHAYAFTCHKSQGGEYRQVLVLTHSAHGGMLNREWFYTACTRAQKRVMVIGDMKGLNGCLRNQAIKGNSLQEKAKSIMAYCQRKIAAGEQEALPVIPQSLAIEGAKLLGIPSDTPKQHLDAKHQADAFFNKLLGLG